MSKLLERLKDPSRSGVYRVTRRDALGEALHGSRIRPAEISLEGAHDRDAILQRLAQALEFPAWFGANWDALEDCLTDLSWRPAEAHVLLIERFAASDELGILLDVLASSAEFWAARGIAFFAVFVDPGRTLSLADLHREP